MAHNFNIDIKFSTFSFNTFKIEDYFENANFKQPNWSSVFKFNLDTDSGIPLNKRGSGVRRLILLNFFRAEARRKLEQSKQEQNNEINIIYAFEEPKNSQHPKFQKMLIDSFKTMSELDHAQVCITTHSPAIAQIVPKDEYG